MSFSGIDNVNFVEDANANDSDDSENEETEDKYDIVEDDIVKQTRHLNRLTSYYNVNSLDETKHTNPIPISIISEFKIELKSTLTFTVRNNVIKEIFWRNKPMVLGCDFNNVKGVERRIKQRGIYIIFSNWELHFKCINWTVENDLFNLIKEQCKNNKPKAVLPSMNSMSFYMPNNQPLDVTSIQTNNSKSLDYEVSTKSEQTFQFLKYLKYKEAFLILEKLSHKFLFDQKSHGLNRWIDFVKSENEQKMLSDRKRWRLHTVCNQENDLQAWYHVMFYHEVYRLRGPFWYRDAVLPQYRKSYSVVDTGMTQLEENAVKNVLCSDDTTYGDVAGQMYVVQAITTPTEYNLFQNVGSNGLLITKFPRMGRPAKKLFRVSFVEGNIFFTWKGKFGNQGVNLGAVNSVVDGISTDLLKRAHQNSKASLFVSLILSERSIDLCLETENDRNLWKSLLSKLVAKEHGILYGIDLEYPEIPNGVNNNPEIDFEWFVLYATLGDQILSPPVRAHLTKLNIAVNDSDSIPSRSNHHGHQNRHGHSNK